MDERENGWPLPITSTANPVRQPLTPSFNVLANVRTLLHAASAELKRNDKSPSMKGFTSRVPAGQAQDILNGLSETQRRQAQTNKVNTLLQKLNWIQEPISNYWFSPPPHQPHKFCLSSWLIKDSPLIAAETIKEWHEQQK